MAADSFTEVSSRNVFQRFGNSVKGILVGVIFFAASFPLLWWNEGRAVHRAQTLNEGEGSVVSISAREVLPDNEGALVHLTGEAATDEVLSDPDFAVSANAIKLRRAVEMFQWEEDTDKETRKKLGGGEETTTTYNYVKGWDERLIDSSTFHHPAGHENPGTMRFNSRLKQAGNVRVEAFQLSDSLIGRIQCLRAHSGRRFCPGNTARGRTAASEHHGRGGLHRSIAHRPTPNAPVIGDLKIAFSRVPATTISLIAKQVGNSFDVYSTKNGTIELLEIGTLDAATLFQMEQDKNKMLTWILRLVGFVLMAVGLSLLVGPLAVIADVVPIFGSLVRGGTAIVAGLLAFVLSMITIAIAWFAYRPLLGVGLLVLAILGIMGLRGAGRGKSAPVLAPTPPPSAPPPPPPSPPAA